MQPDQPNNSLFRNFGPLFGRENSLFRCLGSWAEFWRDINLLLALISPISGLIAKFPCIFPVKQGNHRWDELAPKPFPVPPNPGKSHQIPGPYALQQPITIVIIAAPIIYNPLNSFPYRQSG